MKREGGPFLKKILVSAVLVFIAAGCGSSRYLLDSASMKDSERACLSVNGAIDIITVNGTEVNIIGNKTFHAPSVIYLPAGKHELGVKYHTGSGRHSCGIIPVSIELGAGRKYKMWYYEVDGLVHFQFDELVIK